MAKHPGVVARRKRIVAFLEKSRSIKEVAEEHNTSYHTAREDLIALVEEGYARYAGMLNDKGEQLFVAGGKRPMVEVIVNGHPVPVHELAINWSHEPSMPKTHKAAYTVMQVAMFLMNQAGAEQQIDKLELGKWKKAVVQALPTLQQIVDIAEGLITADRLWDPEQLQLMGTDPEFSKVALQEAYIRYANYVEERDRSARDA